MSFTQNGLWELYANLRLKTFGIVEKPRQQRIELLKRCDLSPVTKQMLGEYLALEKNKRQESN